MTHRHDKAALEPRSRLNAWLLGACLILAALRCTVMESPLARLSTVQANLYDLAYSLGVSAAIFGLAGLWLVRALGRKAPACRPSGMEIGLALFLIAGLISGLAASDKRSAISDVVILAGPAVLGLLLVQVLDRPDKIRLVLILIATLGMVDAFESLDQKFYSNPLTIESYEQDPNSLMGPMGLTQGTLEHFLFEHRLYSSGINGFFTTRNSNGSFLLMALVCCGALVLEGLGASRRHERPRVYPAAAGVMGLLALGIMILTKSKGAVAGLGLAIACLLVYLRFKVQVRRHIRAILSASVVAAALGTGWLIRYGLAHDRLPGGNSMLVRWDYWRATGRMIRDHLLTGVGPGNFSMFYHLYKPDAAIESVSDPHNVLLSLWSQYGVLGMVGFCLMIAGVLARAWAAKAERERVPCLPEPDRRMGMVYIFEISAALLLLRPLAGTMSMDSALVTLLSSMIYVLLLCLGLLVLTRTSQPDGPDDPGPVIEDTRPVLACGLLGVLLANMTDFALFEPGVLTCFWTLVACVAAQPGQTPAGRTLKPGLRRALIVGLLILLVACIPAALVPVLRSTSQIALADRAMAQGNLPLAHACLARATRLDPLSETAPYREGRLYLYCFDQSHELQDLDGAKACFDLAIARNPANFTNYEKLCDTLFRMRRMEPAYQAARQAVDHYPGCERLWYKLAGLCEQLGRTDEAVAAYERAVAIEDAFQARFQRMYPDRPVVSRMGVDTYQTAKERLKMLRNAEF